MDYAQLLKKAELHVIKLFEEHKNDRLVFHNLNHTRYVAEHANEIASNYRLSEKELFVLNVTAWFHDTGYLVAKAEGHEEKSVELMKAFFQQEHDYDVTVVEAITDTIMATRMPPHPRGLLQEIICDADTYNFGTKEFKVTNKLVFEELSFTKGNTLSKAAFNTQTYKMLEHHQFYTAYCQDKLKDGKKANMKKLEKKLDDDLPVSQKINDEYDPIITEKDGTTKGMQTMLRLTSSNHNALSEMADSKANILISVNAIIISLILSILLRKLQTDPYLTIPTILFLTVSVVTIVLAILATRPKISIGTFNPEDITSKKTNLLFFGNFYKVDLDTYERAMRTMMKDSDYLYRSMIKDIYFLGVVLGKKYKLLRLAYNIFMFGIIVSVIAFAIASMIYTAPQETTTQVTNAAGSPF